MSMLSRKEFMRSFGTASVALPLSAVAAQAGIAVADESEISWDMEADIVVVGFGAAGTGAAVSAAEAGASVILLEKMDPDQAGGALSCFGGGFLTQSAELLKYSSYYTWSDERAENTANKALGWSKRAENLDFEKTSINFGSGDMLMSVYGGAAVHPKIVEYVTNTPGISIEYETPATGLIQDGTGKVIGVRAQKNGTEIIVHALKGVVLTSGGYEANKDLFHSLNHPALAYAPMAGPARTGDGMLMAIEIGAQPANLAQNVEWHTFACRKASEELGTGVVMMNPSYTGTLIVNAKGKRFMNETGSITHNKRQPEFLDFYGPFAVNPNHETNGYENLPMWGIWDSAAIAEGRLGGSTITETWALAHGFTWSEDNQAEVEKGWLLKADTLEELATLMVSTNTWGDTVQVDAAALEETISRYNELAEAGEDTDFGRLSSSLYRVAEPPFYACELIPSIIYTMNSLLTDDNSRVLDTHNNPIEGLYAAGDIAQGTVYVVIGVPGSMAQGQIAVEHALGISA